MSKHEIQEIEPWSGNKTFTQRAISWGVVSYFRCFTKHWRECFIYQSSFSLDIRWKPCDFFAEKWFSFSNNNNLTVSIFWHRCYLESESDKDMPAVMQLRLHFARFIYKMITSVPGEWKPYVCGWPREARKHNFSSWSKSSMRELLNAGHFHIFVVFHKEWNDCKSAVLPVTSRTATVTESGELSMADVLTWVRKRRTVKTWASHELLTRARVVQKVAMVAC